MDEFAFDLNTPEGVQSAITGLYVSILGRAPDPDGLDFWINGGDGDEDFEGFNAAVEAGSDPEQVLAGIAESFRLNAAADSANPFSEDAQAVLSAESSEDVTDAQVSAFLNQWFQNALGRDYDPEGADAGLDGAAQLTAALDDDSGADIGNVLVDLLNAVAGGDGNDAATVNNRITAGEAFAEANAGSDDPIADIVAAADDLNDTTGGTGDTGGQTVQVVNADNTGPFDATADDIRFDIESGDFAATIDGFGEGDALNVFEGAGVTVDPDFNAQDDGEQLVSFDNPDSGAVTEITLTGLTSSQDASLTDRDSITETFGSGALGGDVTGGDDTGDDDGSGDGDTGDGAGGVESTQTIDTGETFDAGAGNVQFDIQSGNFTATIENFDEGDVLDLFDGAGVTIDPDFASQDDGEQLISFDNPDSGAVTEIVLTGLTSTQDASLTNRDSITEVFGDGALI